MNKIIIEHKEHLGLLEDGKLRCGDVVHTLCDDDLDIEEMKIDCQHTHNKTCGHPVVIHNDHVDYLVDDSLHHISDSGCENHGLLSTYKDYDRRQTFTKKHPKSNSKRFTSMIVLTGTFFLVELIFGIAIGSLTLQADAFHMASDLIALIIGLLSSHYAKKNERFPIIGGLLNAIFLLSTCFNLTIEAIHRLSQHDDHTILEEQTTTLILVGVLGLCINLFGLCIFHQNPNVSHSHSHSHAHSHGHTHSHSEDLNIKSMYLHVMSDALGSIGVVVGGLFIKYSDWELRTIIDPLITILIVLLIVRSTVPVAKKLINVLSHQPSKLINIQHIENEIKNTPHIVSYHDLKIWQVTNDKNIATIHIVCEQPHYLKIIDSIKFIFHNHNIHTSTIQPEFINFGGCYDVVCENC